MAKGKLLNLFHRRRGLDTPSLSLPGHNSGQEDKQIQDETKSNLNTNKVSELFLLSNFGPINYRHVYTFPLLL